MCQYVRGYYAVRMIPTLNGTSEIQHFKHSDVKEKCNGIMCFFSTRDCHNKQLSGGLSTLTYPFCPRRTTFSSSPSLVLIHLMPWGEGDTYQRVQKTQCYTKCLNHGIYRYYPLPVAKGVPLGTSYLNELYSIIALFPGPRTRFTTA